MTKARADERKPACAKIRRVPWPRHKRSEGTTRSESSNGPGVLAVE